MTIDDVGALFEAFTASLPYGVLLVDADGRVHGAGGRAAALLGVTPDALRGCALADLCADDPDRLAEWLRLCRRTSAPLPGAFVARRAGGDGRLRGEGYGTDVPGVGRCVVLRFWKREERDHFVLLGQKIEELNTEILRRKAAQAELEASRAELARLYDQAQEADRRKDEFLAVLGHELRNPLAPILTALHIMEMGGDEAFLEERTIIERQARHLARLVDDLLDVSRITRGKIELARRRGEIAGPIQRAIEMASPLLDKRGHRLTLAVPPRGLAVEADQERIAQVVTNLLDNAARYTEPGGEITVAAERDGEQVVIRVRDTGCGIDPELLPRIFEPFAQDAGSRGRRQGGLGLGLAIASSLVELHGGTIEAHSDGPGRGSEFVVRLPGAPPAGAAVEAPSPAAEAASAPPQRGRVLIVDDNADAANLLALALEGLGFETRVAFDGPAALHAADEAPPDVALLDLGLPVMDGYDLARHLRARPRLADLPLVAITGYGQDGDRERTLRAGFDEHLVKPVDLRRLTATLERLLVRS